MRKRILIFSILIFSLLWAVCRREGKAEPWSLDGECGPALHWSVTAEGELTITGTGEMTDAPWRTEFAEVSRVNLGEGITSICDQAFENCTKITEVTFPYTLMRIGKSAFSGCKNIKSISMKENVEIIDKYAFWGCEKLEKLSMSSGIKKISESAFNDCYNLKEMKLPEGLEEIGEYAFEECISLKSLVIPGSVKKTGKKMIENATGIKRITNLSKVRIELPKWCGDDSFFTNVNWYVNGKKVKILKPGQTAAAKAKAYQIVYRLQGARIIGKKPKKHIYNVETKLPDKVKKRGYVFYGWKCKSPSRDIEEDNIYSINRTWGGKLYLTPGFATFRVKKGTKQRLKIYVDLLNSCYDYCVEVQYADNKEMNHAVILDLKMQNGKRSGKVTTPKLEKGKRYWVQFRSYNVDEEDSQSNEYKGRYHNSWSTKKSIVIK